MQLDFDPKVVSYAQLLELYFFLPNSCGGVGSRQYASIIFYHNDEQKKLALAARDRAVKAGKTRTVVEVVPYKEFYLAEDYHQKYYLREQSALMREFAAMYPDAKDFVNSTAAAKVNGYVEGNGTAAQLEKEIDSFGLSEKAKAALREMVRGRR